LSEINDDDDDDQDKQTIKSGVEPSVTAAEKDNGQQRSILCKLQYSVTN